MAATTGAQLATSAFTCAAAAAEGSGQVSTFACRNLACTSLARCLARYRALGLWTADPFYREEAFTRLETAMLSAGAIRRKRGFAMTADNAIVAEALARP